MARIRAARTLHDVPERFPPLLESTPHHVKSDANHGIVWPSCFSHFSTIVFLCKQSENVCEDILQLGQGVNAVEIDLMEPLDPEKTPR